ncbi:MAG: hydrogenase maturation protease [Methylovulum sp.]|uniref:hydrogenase maturation protease n=1 Tax=Methylovulum sp. TaxID=1916980 RepID=UPI00261D05C6|nr:hydrogenase maturation protease [Methylovulum sp.]MDD2723211.1 hydrogenase maturation protease [Methylovulum sp.]MDD5123152.1 hydrogenase maturation protease [Methylovulum sp.]
MSETKPVLIFGYGNLSRGDDALGPLLLEYLEENAQQVSRFVDILSDFQLQIEHALDLEHRGLVLFVDASVACTNAFDFTELAPARDDSYTTHAMNPAAVLDVYQNIKKQAPPPCFLLSIKGESFELGEGLSVAAARHLAAACTFVEKLLADLDVSVWRQYTNVKI